MNQYEQFQQQQGIQPTQERELGWEDSIAKEDDFILLPEGDYDFTVESFERARFAGSDKVPPCNQANLKIRIDTPQGKVYINHMLLLHSKTESFVSAFFASIGQKKKGQPCTMNWQLVPGAKGRCKVFQEPYNGNVYNKVKRFLPKETQAPNATSYTPGQF